MNNPQKSSTKYAVQTNMNRVQIEEVAIEIVGLISMFRVSDLNVSKDLRNAETTIQAQFIFTKF